MLQVTCGPYVVGPGLPPASSLLLPSWGHRYPVILSIENHCSVVQQKKMAQYLTDILGDKLDLSSSEQRRCHHAAPLPRCSGARSW